MAVLGFMRFFPKEMTILGGSRSTYFQEKILASLFPDGITDEAVLNNPTLVKGMVGVVRPKLHTIRKKQKRIKKGSVIHFSTDVRTKEQFRFAPETECTKVDDLEIVYNDLGNTAKTCDVIINKENIGTVRFLGGQIVSNLPPVLYALICNDGFDDTKTFFKWFNESGKYDLIHWTDINYNTNKKKSKK